MSDFESNVGLNIDVSQALTAIKTLQRQISDFHSSLAKGSATANLKSLQMQQSLIDTVNATGQYSAQMKTVASATQTFTTALEKNKLSMSQYFRYAGGASKSFGRFFTNEMDTIQKVAIERVKDLQTQYIKMGRDANGAIRSIAVRPLALDMDNLATKTQIAAQKQQLLNQLLKQGSTNLLNFGKNTQWAGRQLMVGFTIPLGIFGATAAKTFMQMEEQAIKFKRVYGDTFTATKETDAMLKQVQQLASEFTKYGVAVEKTMEQAAKAAATGKMGAELLAQVSEATRLSVLGNVEQSQALETTISLTNAFGTAADELRGKINFLNAVENQTVTSIEDLTTAIPKAAPVIKQLGGNVEDLAFFLTAMREGGINASESANALKSGLASLINPTKKASDFLQSFGININKIVEGNKGDVKGLVVDFAKALDTLDPLNRARAIEQLFGKFQFSRLSTLFQNVIKDGSQAAKVLELTRQSSAELGILAQRELNRISASPMYKFQKAIADFKKELAPVGEEFLKAVTPIIQFGTDMLKAFNNLDGGVKQFIVNATGLVAGLGPIFLMTFGLIANGVANIIKGFTFVKTVFNKASSASTVLGETTDYMTQQQIEAAAAAASLEQVHNKLTQAFTVETTAVGKLAAAYQKAVSAQNAFTGPPATGKPRRAKKYAAGVFSVPGPKGAGDIVPAMLSPGEAVIPAKQAQRYRGFIKGMISGNIPGFNIGTEEVEPPKKQRKPKTLADAISEIGSEQPKHITSQTGNLVHPYFPNEQQIVRDAFAAQGFDIENNPDDKRSYGGYVQPHAAHTGVAGSSRAVTIETKGGKFSRWIKNWMAKLLTPQLGVMNKYMQDISHPDMEALANDPKQKGKKVVLYRKFMHEDHIKRVAKALKIPVAEVRKLAAHLFAGNEALTPQQTAVLGEIAKTHRDSVQVTDKMGKNAKRKARAEIARTESVARVADYRLATANDPKGFFLGRGSYEENEAKRKAFDATQERKLQAATNKATVAEIKARNDQTAASNEASRTSRAKAAESKKERKEAKKPKPRTRKPVAKPAAKTTQAVSATPKIRTTEQLGDGLSRVVTTDSNGKQSERYYLQGRKGSVSAKDAQAMLAARRGATTPGGKLKSFFSGTMGRLGMASMVASMGASAIPGVAGTGIDSTLSTLSYGLMGAEAARGLFGGRQKFDAEGKPLPSRLDNIKKSDAYKNISSKISGSKIAGRFGEATSAAKTFKLDAAASVASKGLMKSMPMLAKGVSMLALRFLNVIPVVGQVALALEVVYTVATANARAQEEISKSIVETLTMTKEKLDGLNEFFGSDAKLSGIRTLSVTGEGQSGEQATLAEQFRQSEQFKNTYKETAGKLKDASPQQFALTMQSLGVDLYGQGMSEEQVQIIIDAIKKEAGQQSVVIKFKDLRLDTETGRENLAKSLKIISDGAVKEFQSNRDFLGLNFEAQAKLDEYESQMSGFISGLSQEFEKGRISSSQFEASFGDIEAAFNKAEAANPGDGLQLLNSVLMNVSPEVAQASAAISDMSTKMLVLKLAAEGAAMSTQLLADAAVGNEKAIKHLEGLDKLEKDKNKRIRQQEKIIQGISQQQQNLQKEERNLNDVYDERIKALERINQLQEQTAKQKQNQLDLADALSRGDVFAAAQAMQKIRADQAALALEQQKNILLDEKDKKAKGIQDKADSLDGALSSARAKIGDINAEQGKKYESEINAATIEQMYKGVPGKLWNILNWQTYFADEQTKYKEFSKYIAGDPGARGNISGSLGILGGLGGSLNPVGTLIKGGLGIAGTVAGSGKKEKTKAAGGYISGPGSGTSDSIPARLSNGEYVIRAKAVKALGTDALDKLNHAEKFAKGGMVRRDSSGYIGPRPTPPFWDEDLRKYVVTQGSGDGFWQIAERYLPEGRDKDSWWREVIAANTNPETGKFPKLFGNSKVIIPGYVPPRDEHIYQQWMPGKARKTKDKHGGLPTGIGGFNRSGMGGLGLNRLFAKGGLVGKPKTGSTASIFSDDKSVDMSDGNVIGHGLNFVMNSIYEMLFGKWAVKTKQGTPTAPDLEDMGTMAMNIVPIPGMKGFKSAQLAAKGFMQTGTVAGAKAAQSGVKALDNFKLASPLTRSGVEIGQRGTYIPTQSEYYLKAYKADTAVPRPFQGINEPLAYWLSQRLGSSVVPYEFLEFGKGVAGDIGPFGMVKDTATLVASRINPNLVPGLVGNVHGSVRIEKMFLDAYRQGGPEALQKAIQEYLGSIQKYADNTSLMNTLLGNADIHGQNVMYDTASKAITQLDFGHASLFTDLLSGEFSKLPTKFSYLDDFYSKNPLETLTPGDLGYDVLKLEQGLQDFLKNNIREIPELSQIISNIGASKTIINPNNFLEGLSGLYKAGDPLEAFAKEAAGGSRSLEKWLTNMLLKDVQGNYGKVNMSESFAKVVDDMTSFIPKLLEKLPKTPNWFNIDKVAPRKPLGEQGVVGKSPFITHLANGGLVKYAKGGMVKRDVTSSDPGINWLNEFIQNLLGGGNPSASMQNDSTKALLSQSYTQGAKNMGVDPTDPMFYATMFGPSMGLKALGAAGKGVSKLKGLSSLKASIPTTTTGFKNYLPDAYVNFMRSNPKIAVRMQSERFMDKLSKKDFEYRNRHSSRDLDSMSKPEREDFLDSLRERADIEENVFGIRPDAPGSARPIYGAAVDTRVPWGIRGKQENDLQSAMSILRGKYSNVSTTNFDRYGDMSLILKNRVKKRSTFTLGDTYSKKNFDGFNGYPGQEWDGYKAAIPAPFGTKSRSQILAADSEVTKNELRFVEAQIFGGLPFSDVKRIIVRNPELIAPLRKSIAQAGLRIPVGESKLSPLGKFIKMLNLKDKSTGLPSFYVPFNKPYEIPKFKTGGMFRTPYANGGLAMLHDKEFVMNAGAVKDYGVNNLKAMNNGTYSGGSVYNSYGVNINVGGSNSNANDIARTVIREIKRLDSQNIRSTKV